MKFKDLWPAAALLIVVLSCGELQPGGNDDSKNQGTDAGVADGGEGDGGESSGDGDTDGITDTADGSTTGASSINGIAVITSFGPTNTARAKKVTRYWSDGELELQTTAEFDVAGNKIKEVVREGVGLDHKSTRIETFNDQRRTLTSVTYADEALTQKRYESTYTYTDGNITQSIVNKQYDETGDQASDNLTLYDAFGRDVSHKSEQYSSGAIFRTVLKECTYVGDSLRANNVCTNKIDGALKRKVERKYDTKEEISTSYSGSGSTPDEFVTHTQFFHIDFLIQKVTPPQGLDFGETPSAQSPVINIVALKPRSNLAATNGLKKRYTHSVISNFHQP